ncbi:hypothetical protein KIN20_006163 [Parelaphostrongylus tenuis]|uniref:ubiquitinyl hydrolase 1 n=1 Tax=Parelaphostrongylus tenuis TaxID=148309 RepID=A0AAD5QGI6_PARTN|nr:hypothetical protein KIN20_006163 [Parelaphostrongylus tenuis]
MKQTRKVAPNINGDPSLHDMLGCFLRRAVKPEESWYCNKCRDMLKQQKNWSCSRLPPILIVQLKRFVYTATYQAMHRRSKDERRVIYPIANLDMSPFLAETAPTEQNTIYDLTGVVCHSCSSYFGHYVSIGRFARVRFYQNYRHWRLFRRFYGYKAVHKQRSVR